MHPYLQLFFGAMLPIIELRGTIPYGIFHLHLNPFVVFFWSVLGNLMPNILILWLLPHLAEPLRHRLHFVDEFLKKTHDKHSENFKSKGLIFIILFVGIPIPGSGSWTGSLLAYLFDLEFKKALFAISLGVVMAGIIILGLSTGVFSLLQQLLFSHFS